MSPSAANRAIELHDSFLAVLEATGDRVRVVFEPGYVHETQGVPGLDPGTGLLQTIELFVESGSIEGALTALPFDVSDGTLTIDDQIYLNLLPLPMNRRGNIELKLLLKSSECVVIRGAGITTRFEGLPEDAEDFPGVRS
jgi:hypothetical protein